MEWKRNLSIPLFLPFKDLSFFMGFQTIGHCPGGTRTSRRFLPLGKKARKQFQPHISGNMEWNTNLSIPLFLPLKDLSFSMGFQTIGHCLGGARGSRRFSPLGKNAKKQFQPHLSGNMEWNTKLSIWIFSFHHTKPKNADYASLG